MHPNGLRTKKKGIFCIIYHANRILCPRAHNNVIVRIFFSNLTSLKASPLRKARECWQFCFYQVFQRFSNMVSKNLVINLVYFCEPLSSWLFSVCQTQKWTWTSQRLRELSYRYGENFSVAITYVREIVIHIFLAVDWCKITWSLKTRYSLGCGCGTSPTSTPLRALKSSVDK